MQPKYLEDFLLKSQGIGYIDYLTFFSASPVIKEDTYSTEMQDLWEHIKRTHFPSKSLKFNLVMED